MPVLTDDVYTAPAGTLAARFGDAAGPPPSVVQPPASVAVTEPAAASFTVAVVGAASLQWQRTGPADSIWANVPGQVGTVYNAGATATAADNGRQVRAAVTNGAGTVYSAAATLTVNPGVPISPSASIVQYITHDGDAVGNVVTSSAPNRLYWNTVLEVPWARGALGDWRDQAGTANGTVPYASFPAVAAVGRRTLSVTALVQRWRANGLNRGIYLAARANAFPLMFAGRTAINAGDRPELGVVTTTGTFNLQARANASWNSSSVSVLSSSSSFELRAGQGPAIVQFDLSTVTGTVTSATLGITLLTLTQTGAIVDVFEADPPALFDPAMPVGAVQGIGAGGDFNALRTHPDVLFADDFATPGPFDSGWSQAVTRALDTGRGTTIARSFVATGGLPSADRRINIVNSLSYGGVTNPAQRRDSAHATIRFMMESSFAGLTDKVKIPAMGSQLGFWNTNSGGYWQPITGNGGFPGTGLKVLNGAQVEYHGHSSRLLTGYRCSDVSAYSDYVNLGAYIYHLDQGGPFPGTDPMPGLVLKRGAWYDMSHFLQLNTMSGVQDGLGNYATANPDGIYRLHINGQLVYNRTNFRWRRHAEFSVQGFWVDVYHGGTNPADRDMYYQLNELAIASSYIGPVRQALQLSGTNWTPNRDGAGRILDTDWAQLPKGQIVETTGTGDTIDETLPTPRYPKRSGQGNDGSPGIVSAWSGAAVNRELQELYITGGGHGDSHFCENGYQRLRVDTLKVDTLAPASPLSATREWNVAENAWRNNDTSFPQSGNGSFGPLADSRAGSIHTYMGLVHVPAAQVGNAGGKVLKDQHTMESMDLPSAVFDTPYFNPSDPQIGSGGGGYLNMLVSWPYGLLPVDSFYIRVFKWDIRAHSWYSLNAGGAPLPNAQSAGAYVIPPFPGSFGASSAPTAEIPYAYMCLADRTDLRKAWWIGYRTGTGAIEGVRFDYGAWVDNAVATGNWGNSGNYQSRVTLTGPSASVFTQASLQSDIPAGRPFAYCGLDYDAGRLWLVGNLTGNGVYRIDGVDGNSPWSVTQVSGASVARQNTNGTYGRFRTFKRGAPGQQVTVGVRISSTTTPPEIVRLTDPGE